MGSKIQDPRFPGKTPEQSWILDLGSEPRLKFQSVQSVSIGIQDSANRPLGRFPPLPKDLPNSMSVIALILVDLWGGVPYICIFFYSFIYLYARTIMSGSLNSVADVIFLELKQKAVYENWALVYALVPES